MLVGTGKRKYSPARRSSFSGSSELCNAMLSIDQPPMDEIEKELSVWADVLELQESEKPPGCYISTKFWGNYFGNGNEIVEGIDSVANHFKRVISDNLNKKGQREEDLYFSIISDHYMEPRMDPEALYITEIDGSKDQIWGSGGRKCVPSQNVPTDSWNTKLH